MLLRPRQKVFVERCLTALEKHGNTLGVAPTGSGKTVMLSALVGRLMERGSKSALILQHRDELTAQNRKTFHRVNPVITQSGVINATMKEYHEPVAFAMVPTIARNLGRIVGPVDITVVDEAHHIAAKSYQDTLGRLYDLNPDMKLIGVTATPQRGDRTSLTPTFTNVGDQITIEELIRSGLLVRPRFFVVDIGVREELENVRKLVADFDMAEVAKVMDHHPLNEKVVEHWKEKAGDRQTVVFCSTIEHAEHICAAYREASVSARMVSSKTSAVDRKEILADFDASAFQVLVNVMVLTEGWDCPPVDCIVLLRPSSYKSTMIQMVGRGLRKIDPERHPGVTKTDCIVLDFGTSVLTHGTLEQSVDLEPDDGKGEAPMKVCPECNSEVPLGVQECPLCGYVFPVELAGGGEADEKEGLEHFTMSEVDIFNSSPFQWEEFWDGVALIANGFTAWGLTIFYAGEWHAIGGMKGKPLAYLANGDKLLCLSSADDFIRMNEKEDSAHKSRRWLHLQATDRQRQYLRVGPGPLNRYRASCMLTWQFNEQNIQKKLTQVGRKAA